MKKIIISLIIVFAFSNIYAGPNSSTLENSPLVENVTNQDHEVFVYKLYPTQKHVELHQIKHPQWTNVASAVRCRRG